MPTPDREFPVAPPAPLKGRGAVTNMQGRYEKDARERVDDGWLHETDGDDEGAPPLRTQVFEERAKSILTHNNSPDIPFSVSLNPYRGCEHGCIYCFARPTHSYLGLSPGLDFESRIYAKINAAELLRREIGKPKYEPESIALGVNTDAYQPVERDLKITRSVIQVLHDCGHPFAAITKSSLIERDIDLLAPMAERGQVMAAITVTTLDADIARTLEPRAATPARRLRTIRTLAEAGIPVGVSIAPVIPFVTEPDLERVLEACAEAGAKTASYIVLRLPWEVAPLFKDWLAAHFPDRADRVMSRVRDMRGGKDYDADFAKRMKGEGLWADMLKQRFQQATKRLGLNARQRGILDMSDFKPPAFVKPVPDKGQLDLF
ncbi:MULTISPECIES: PA0069 family radical SAM protein [unclassified Caballeronia]|uniref:PA0069 family radical SAM protein n=1 Tax=unclassified Caballeronia TaxID=2646786 RepID=UPI00285C1BF3|nr:MULTISPECIES: PA0069 family radical SAM protein [unclassified Caballeronia]MDR5772238.1 PA0069 family radical SAM protein [Caballeronia sp. LZ002]MDR5847672.1 PA0069 family radical SAM protein [Caballeronia sp. LZ003]